ncbi:MAG: hypothetical protein V1850_00520, partial [Candidatus Bathyarchaeota archaeon]
MSYDSYNLFRATDDFLTRPKFNAQRETRFYPSEASVEIEDKYGHKTIQGGCLRASYFRCSGEVQGAVHNARSEWIFMQGKLIEEMLIVR